MWRGTSGLCPLDPPPLPHTLPQLPRAGHQNSLDFARYPPQGTKLHPDENHSALVTISSSKPRQCVETEKCRMFEIRPVLENPNLVLLAPALCVWGQTDNGLYVGIIFPSGI